ncbi:hypothetical protein BKA82DRAFT_378132 [Pisolithus tinctorius]|uniref:Uncharacterized protein n=1 Tax=Pisolithus tinctorius Marx 270 TaxID=870435 RepID=A0A0C3P4I7_PISTI|nr:hypothetical protein BKA82DRAFT_378132 [Pisolithus tinctorius]KIO07960.1 hypothetical protein M404DRAFT_378132 [Pisolithus tinctorius Marx 270]
MKKPLTALWLVCRSRQALDRSTRIVRCSPGPDPIRTSELSHNVRLPHILARSMISVH